MINRIKNLFWRIINIVKQNFTTIILFLIGIIIISWILYNRLFLKRESIDITFEYNILKLWLYFYFLVINIFCLFVIIIEILIKAEIIDIKKPRKYRVAWKRYLYSRLKAIFSIPINSIKTVYNYTFRTITKREIVFDFCCSMILKYSNYILPGISISILFCQLFVVLMLALDIFYFHKFNLFYKALILLLYPLAIKGLLYALKDYAEEGFSEMEKFAIPYLDEVNKEWTFIWREEMNYCFDQTNFDLLIIAYASLKSMINIINWIHYYTHNYPITQCIQIFKHTLYIFCWGYLLFNTLQLFFY